MGDREERVAIYLDLRERSAGRLHPKARWAISGTRRLALPADYVGALGGRCGSCSTPCRYWPARYWSAPPTRILSRATGLVRSSAPRPNAPPCTLTTSRVGNLSVALRVATEPLCGCSRLPTGSTPIPQSKRGSGWSSRCTCAPAGVTTGCATPVRPSSPAHSISTPTRRTSRAAYWHRAACCRTRAARFQRCLAPRARVRRSPSACSACWLLAYQHSPSCCSSW